MNTKRPLFAKLNDADAIRLHCGLRWRLDPVLVRRPVVVHSERQKVSAINELLREGGWLK